MQSVESRVAVLNSLRGALEEQASRPVGLSDKRFDETHERFERSSNQQPLIMAWLGNLIRSQYASLDPLRILSVGCGSGILDNPLIEAIATTSRRVEYTGVDPNPVACRRFREDFDSLQLSNVRLDVREQNVESIDATERFDIIHLVHSLYYFQDPAGTLDCLLGLLASGGKAVIVQAPEAELNQLAQCFWKHHANSGIWFSDCLGDHLSQRRLAFSKERIDGEVDVARCFEVDCSRGEMLLDFITQSDCQQLDDDIVQSCLSYLRSVSRSADGRILVAHPADVFVIDAANSHNLNAVT